MHRCAERGTSGRGESHEPPLTVLAEDELPVLADPVDSDDEPVLLDEEEADGDGVDVDDEVTEEVDAALVVVDVPVCVCAARTARAATAAVPPIPRDVVSLPRSRSARSRSATVMRRFGAAITAAPGSARERDAIELVFVVPRGPDGALRAGR
jgi:hypothetical protein